MQTHEWAPRVLIANSNLVGDWATWPEFRRLEQLGLTMYGQMTAGSWIYIGTQGILQGTYETFAAVAAKRFGGTLAGTLTLTGGCGGMGGAQPLAVTLNERRLPDRRRRPGPAAPPGRAPLPRRGGRRPGRGGRDRRCAAKDERRRAGRSGWSATPPRCSPSCCAAACDRRRHRPDLRPRPAVATCPRASSVDGLGRVRRAEARGVHRPGARARWPGTSQAMVGFLDAGAEVFDYGNSIRDEARQGGCERAFDFPGFVPAYIRPLFCEGKGPFRWVALSGDPDGHRRHRPGRARPVPRQRPAAQVDPRRPGAHRVPGAARRGSAGSARASATRPGLRVQRARALRRGQAPIVIGRDHLDTGSVASPYRETESMLDGSDAIADWPLLNALVNTSSGRLLGVDPPRRWRRHRPLAARRAGVASPTAPTSPRAEARAGADQRPGDGRHPARRRGLRRRRAHRAGAGRPHPDARGLTAPPDFVRPTHGSRGLGAARTVGKSHDVDDGLGVEEGATSRREAARGRPRAPRGRCRAATEPTVRAGPQPARATCSAGDEAARTDPPATERRAPATDAHDPATPGRGRRSPARTCSTTRQSNASSPPAGHGGSADRECGIPTSSSASRRTRCGKRGGHPQRHEPSERVTDQVDRRRRPVSRRADPRRQRPSAAIEYVPGHPLSPCPRRSTASTERVTDRDAGDDVPRPGRQSGAGQQHGGRRQRSRSATRRRTARRRAGRHETRSATSGRVGDVGDVGPQGAHDVVGRHRGGHAVRARRPARPCARSASRRRRPASAVRRPERCDRAALVPGHLRAVAASGIDSRLTPRWARSLGQEISRSPGTSTNRKSSSPRRTTSVLTMSRGSTPRAAAASASEPTRPWRVTANAMPDAVSAPTARSSPLAVIAPA